MKSNYSLLIPTYNRPDQLASLLRYLDREQADFGVTVLDSGTEETRSTNRALVNDLSLDVGYREYDETTHPFEKFLDGVENTQTPFCQLCADDDLIFIEGTRQAIDALLADPSSVCAHGYYFMFLQDEHDNIEVPYILYFSPTNSHNDPLARLQQQFRNYQALTYGVYRTPVMKAVLTAVKGVTATLSKELLSGALTVIKGKAIRLQCFSHARNMGPSEAYTRWHPLEWLFRDCDDLFAEYRTYRDIVLENVDLTGGSRSHNDALEIVDLIHLHYLLRHAPRDAYGYMLDQFLAGQKIDDFWRAQEVQGPLSKVPYVGRDGREERSDAGGARYLDTRIRRFKERIKTLLSGESPAEFLVRQTEVRRYRFHPDFLNPSPIKEIKYQSSDVDLVIKSLDNYRPGTK